MTTTLTRRRGLESDPRRVATRFDAGDAYGASFPLWGGLGVVLVTDADALDAVLDTVTATLDDVDRACSAYRDDSDLVRLNAADGRPVVVSAMLRAAVEVALDAAAWTDGIVDPTVGAATLPGTAAVALPPAVALPLTVAPTAGRPDRWREVSLDRGLGAVTLPRGVALDLGATAKAWAADLCATNAAAVAGGTGVLVSLAGDLAVTGPAPAGGWRVRVTDDHRTDPDDAAVAGATVLVTTGGLATSSTTVRRRTTPDGRSVAHVVDPRTMAPVTPAFRTVSVAAASCTTANAASTAALVLDGAAPGWLEARGLPARLVRTDGSTLTVAGWPDDTTTPGSPA